jgi:hypothetical protein
MNSAFFETEQTKLAVRLWTAVKKANKPLFDVLVFNQNWSHADHVLTQCLEMGNEEVTKIVIELMQARALLLQQDPDKARKLGAKLAAPEPEPKSGHQTKPETEKVSADAIKAHYLKGLR